MAGVQCCANPPVLDPRSGLGTVVDDLGGIKAYTAGVPGSKLAVVLISDVFGYEAPNLRKIADKIAAAGFYVVVPDLFHGEPYNPTSDITLASWLKSHKPEKGYEESKPLIAALKEQGVSAIGAAGICCGAKVVIELAKTGDINAAVMLHPSLVTEDDMKQIKSNICMLGAEIDDITPPEMVKQFAEILSTKSEINNFVKIYPGVEHGWALRYDANDESAAKKAEEAHEDMVGWLAKNLK